MVVILNKDEPATDLPFQLSGLKQKHIFVFTMDSKYVKERVKYTYSQRVKAVRNRIQKEDLFL
jgi:hypothetical protein